MVRYRLYIFLLVAMALMAPLGIGAADRSFSNSDLDRYKGDSNGRIIPETITPAPIIKEKPPKKREDKKAQQYWCSRGSSQRAKVDRARARVGDAERKLADLGEQPRKKKARANAEKKLRSAKKELYRAEQSLDELEQSAHRQDVPPGWLRCQFSY